MKKLREELQVAEEKMKEASREYIKKSTQQNYHYYQYWKRYWEGLKKAFDLIEGVEEE